MVVAVVLATSYAPWARLTWIRAELNKPFHPMKVYVAPTACCTSWAALKLAHHLQYLIPYRHGIGYICLPTISRGPQLLVLQALATRSSSWDVDAEVLVSVYSDLGRGALPGGSLVDGCIRGRHTPP